MVIPSLEEREVVAIFPAFACAVLLDASMAVDTSSFCLPISACMVSCSCMVLHYFHGLENCTVQKYNAINLLARKLV